MVLSMSSQIHSSMPLESNESGRFFCGGARKRKSDRAVTGVIEVREVA
jgi:hypothetical protein